MLAALLCCQPACLGQPPFFGGTRFGRDGYGWWARKKYCDQENTFPSFMYRLQPKLMACQAPSSGWLEETMEEFRTSAVANSYVAVTNLAFDSVNDARAKCRDACDAVEKCKGFYFQGRTDDKEQNICNLYSTCEIRKQNWAVGSLYTPIDETANCCKPLTICTDKQYETKRVRQQTGPRRPIANARTTRPRAQATIPRHVHQVKDDRRYLYAVVHLHV